MPAMLAAFRPDAVLHDYRQIGTWGGTPQDWRSLIEGWWEMLPDSRMDGVRLLRAEGDRLLHVAVSRGTDSVSGGTAEFEFFAVIVLDDGLIAMCDFFDDEASAVEHFERLGQD